MHIMQLSHLNPATYRVVRQEISSVIKRLEGWGWEIKKGAASCQLPEHPVRVKDPPDPIGITALSFHSPFAISHPETSIPLTTTSCNG
jgi:hypothetical protein